MIHIKKSTLLVLLFLYALQVIAQTISGKVTTMTNVSIKHALVSLSSNPSILYKTDNGFFSLSVTKL